MGLFGTSASILVDINLILQYVTLILLIVGYVKKKPFKTHGYIMMTVLLITLGTTLLIMGPRLLDTFSTYGPNIIAHAGLGIASMLLGTLFVSRFIIATRNQQPLACGSRRLMLLALFLWILPILFGTMFYITTYV